MPSNKLRTQAGRFLFLPVEAHDRGRIADAHQLTLKAAEFLEDAVSLEELRSVSSVASTKTTNAR
jgi:hypothetical protein